MAWYYYSGNIPRPIPVKKGLSKIAKPHSKIEVLVETSEMKAMKARKMLKLTSKPRDAVSDAETPVPEKKLEDVLPKSDLARGVAERGVTSSRSIKPTVANGKKEEITEIEENSGKVVEAEVLKKKDKKRKNKKGSEGQSKK
jgi:hypothetical protein